MSYVPRVNPIVGGSNWYGGRPGIVTVNFDPLDADYAEFTENLADGTLIIQYASPGEDCDQECAVGIFIKNCSTCDTPVVSFLSAPSDAAALVDGAVATPASSNLVRITKASAAALTLAAPSADQDGKTLTIVSTTAFAHTVTQAAPGFNGGGGGSDVATFAAAVGNSISLVASGGVWYVTNLQGVTLG